jgi:outer membrane translocation and assembly module TamA
MADKLKRSSALRLKRTLFTVVTTLLLAPSLLGQCTGKLDQRSSKTSGVFIADMKIAGTRTLGSNQLNNLASKLVGLCFDDDPEELKERVRLLFQDRGYFKVEIHDLRIKTVDALAAPRSVNLEADVAEGPRFRIGEIDFTGNRAYKSSQLRALFPVKKGEVFKRSRIGTGLEALRRAYGSLGYIDYNSIPDSEEVSDNTLNFSIQVNEGPQYRMGKLAIFANQELEEKLRAQWDLAEGAVFDENYVKSILTTIASCFLPAFRWTTSSVYETAASPQ